MTTVLALPDNLLALSGAGLDVKLFSLSDGAVLRKFTLPHVVLRVSLMPDGRRFVGIPEGQDTAFIIEHGLAPFSP